jgi:hypothetical protein
VGTTAAATDPRALLRDLEWSAEGGTECARPTHPLAAAAVLAYPSTAAALDDAPSILAAMELTILDPRVSAEDADAFRKARDSFAVWAAPHLELAA